MLYKYAEKIVYLFKKKNILTKKKETLTFIIRKGHESEKEHFYMHFSAGAEPCKFLLLNFLVISTNREIFP